jgi:hypothetical protein
MDTLFEAIKQNDIDNIGRLLNQSDLVNGIDGNNRTALMYAALHGQTKTVSLLLDRGADINAADNDGHNALMIAAVNANTGTVTILINSGANIHKQDNDGWTPLMWAARGGSTEIETLIFDSQGEYSTIVLPREIVKILLNSGADINHKDKFGNNALKVASGRGHSETARFLLDYGTGIKI